MDLSELLSELRENILHDRSYQIAGPSDLLWSDATLVRYINEAQRRFARQALIIHDGSSTEAAKITLRNGQERYELHPSVIAVLSARFDGEADLIRAGHTAFDVYRSPDPIYFDPGLFVTIPPGKPLAYSTDELTSTDDWDSMSVVTLRMFPVPDATYDGQVLRLRVVRMPLDDLTTDNMDATPEIPRDHHLEMLDWAAYLALRIVDRDAGDIARAMGFKATFEENVDKARKLVLRKIFTPLQWSFGKNAWSWER